MDGFLYETHMHTSEASACAVNTGAEMARAYKAAGYTGIIITDHFFYGNTAVDRKLPWRQWVERFCLGYEHAREEGERIGLQVFFGWESGYQGTEFLVYGPDKNWLLEHPEIRDATVEEQMKLVLSRTAWPRWRASMPAIPAGKRRSGIRNIMNGRFSLRGNMDCP